MKVYLNDGKRYYFSSVEISQRLGWQHKNLLAKIKKILEKNDLFKFEIIKSSYKGINGKILPKYLISNKGVMMVAGTLKNGDLQEELCKDAIRSVNKFILKSKKGFEKIKENTENLKEKSFQKANLRIKEMNKKIKLLENENFELRNKNDFLDKIMASNDSIPIFAFAKILSKKGCKIGGINLFKWLRKNKYLCSSKKFYNMPMQRYLDDGIFELIETPFHMPNSDGIYLKPMITPKGQIYLFNKLKEVI